MSYSLRSITSVDMNFIYNLKKSSNYNYVANIWGWNEEYQLNDFNSDFNTCNFKVIICENNDIGFLQINEFLSTINITEMHIISEWQGKGIGSSIINDIIKNAYDNNKLVTIGCFIENYRCAIIMIVYIAIIAIFFLFTYTGIIYNFYGQLVIYEYLLYCLHYGYLWFIVIL